MGKMAIILIVGLTIIVGIMSVSMIGRTNDASKASAATFKKAYAKNIASSAAEYYIRQVKATPTLRGTFSISSILNGTATVTLSDWTGGVTDSVRLTSIGIYNAAQETVTVKAISQSFLTVNSAINFRTSSVLYSPQIDVISGYDHDINGVLLSPSSNDRRGAGVTRSADSTTLANNGSATITGTKKIMVDGAIPDPQSFATSLIGKADYILSGSIGSNQTWGSASSPKIVFVNGNCSFAKDCVGWGILLINANTISAKKSLTFHGLVVFYSSSTISFDVAKDFTVVGGFLLSAPTQISYQTKKNAQISYSKAALDMAKSVAGSGGKYAVANWSE